MNNNPLGIKTEYIDKYTPSLLFPIPRNTNREQNYINTKVLNGYDVWNCYELSYLNENGKPVVRFLKIIYDCNSLNIVESKSLKLYLNSFSMEKFPDDESIKNIIKDDLSKVLNPKKLEIFLYKSDYFNCYTEIPDSYLIDNLDIKITGYELNPDILKNDLKIYKNKLVVNKYSNLLKSNCPITGQPDWATLYISYKSDIIINDSSLLRYIISYRNHGDYHENCCENIFNDIFKTTNPEHLLVKCFFTRRGGIDINPVRYYGHAPYEITDFHYWRQ